MSVVTRKIISPIREFISDSRSVGIVLLICTALSLIVSNTGAGPGFIHFWEKELTHGTSSIHLPHSPLHIINDGLMAVFFLLVGLEIKRELMVGELSDFKQALLPVIGAMGGMVVPALFYLFWCGNTPFKGGWGIPMATDIAFSLAVLSLRGKRAPFQLRIFLTALAIIDDLGGILTIAIFYAQQIQWVNLAVAGGILALLITLNLLKVKTRWLYFLPGIFLWYFVYNSGIHATIAGVALAFCIPLNRIETLEHTLHDPVNFIILPIFALANTALQLPSHFGPVLSSAEHQGVFTGLLLGKPVGILLACWLAIKFGLARLPSSITWRHLAGAGIVAGIGFTMSIFITALAFSEPEAQLTAKVAVLNASLLAGLLGYSYLRLLHKKQLLPQQKTATPESSGL